MGFIFPLGPPIGRIHLGCSTVLKDAVELQILTTFLTQETQRFLALPVLQFLGLGLLKGG